MKDIKKSLNFAIIVISIVLIPVIIFVILTINNDKDIEAKSAESDTTVLIPSKK